MRGLCPRVADAAFVVIPPTLVEALPQKGLGCREVGLGRYVEGDHPVPLDALALDAEWGEQSQHGLPIAVQRPVPERVHPDRAIAGPLRGLQEPPLLVPMFGLDDVAAGD